MWEINNYDVPCHSYDLLLIQPFDFYYNFLIINCLINCLTATTCTAVLIIKAIDWTLYVTD